MSYFEAHISSTEQKEAKGRNYSSFLTFSCSLNVTHINIEKKKRKLGQLYTNRPKWIF